MADSYGCYLPYGHRGHRLRYLRSLTVAENKAAKPSLTVWISEDWAVKNHLWGKSVKIF